MADAMLHVYAPNLQIKYTACHYYRVTVPLHGLEALYKANVYAGHESRPTEEQHLQASVAADINLLWNPASEDDLYAMRVLRDIRAAQGDNGELIIPTSTVYDIDDNQDFIHPFNAAPFAQRGVRDYPDGKLLEPGDSLSFNLSDGTPVAAWKDGVTRDGSTVFDIARNLAAMTRRHEIIHTAHGVTVSTPALASYMTDVIGAEHIHVFPNTMIADDWPHFDLVPKPGIRILWQGGASHFIDWYPLRDAIAEVVKRHPEVTWVVFGAPFDWLRDIPGMQIEHHKWVPMEAYQLKRATLQCDINLCPLARNAFNACKSAIKFYEGAIQRPPEGTLAANVGPYKAEIIDGETGLLYDTPEEFVQKLCLLIENAELRTTLARKAKKWVLTNRTPEQTIPPLYDFYQELRRMRMHEYLVSQGASSGEIKRLARQQGLLR